MTTRTDRNQVFDADGNLISEVVEEVDITAETNERSLRDQATQAMTDNRTYLAIATPTNAQVAAQVRALTRQNNGIMRLLLKHFDGTD